MKENRFIEGFKRIKLLREKEEEHYADLRRIRIELNKIDNELMKIVNEK